MSNILKSFLEDALDILITNIHKNLKEQNEIQEEEKRHKKFMEGSIDVEFKVKEDKKDDMSNM